MPGGEFPVIIKECLWIVRRDVYKRQDIDRVYHVAPSSTFVDYIQEIGRAARDKNITGVAVTDFNERDFYYMKRLHSAGAISQEQLGMILKKVWEIRCV